MSRESRSPSQKGSHKAGSPLAATDADVIRTIRGLSEELTKCKAKIKSCDELYYQYNELRGKYDDLSEKYEILASTYRATKDAIESLRLDFIYGGQEEGRKTGQHSRKVSFKESPPKVKEIPLEGRGKKVLPKKSFHKFMLENRDRGYTREQLLKLYGTYSQE